ncbi:Macrophage killing protein with similarity to conjugation protein [Escherichia coli]|nr:Macrophage killing protein with similarity to conjugation protein [Escherichia coli]
MPFRPRTFSTLLKRRNLTSQHYRGRYPGQPGTDGERVWFWKFQYPSGCAGRSDQHRPEQAFTFEITVRRVDPASNPAAWKSARWFPVTPQQESETHIMHIHHLIGALLIVCGTVTVQITRAGKMHEARRPAERPHRQPGTPRQAVPASRTTPGKPAASRRCSCTGRRIAGFPLNASEIRELRGIMADNERAISARSPVWCPYQFLTVNLSPGPACPCPYRSA